jgi:hypothetical protein
MRWGKRSISEVPAHRFSPPQEKTYQRPASGLQAKKELGQGPASDPWAKIKLGSQPASDLRVKINLDP